MDVHPLHATPKKYTFPSEWFQQISSWDDHCLRWKLNYSQEKNLNKKFVPIISLLTIAWHNNNASLILYSIHYMCEWKLSLIFYFHDFFMYVACKITCSFISIRLMPSWIFQIIGHDKSAIIHACTFPTLPTMYSSHLSSSSLHLLAFIMLSAE